MTTTRDVASLTEAFSVKEELNHDGDYEIQAWEKGRQIALEFPDSLIYLRWIDFVKARLPSEKGMPSVSEVTLNESAPNLSLEGMQGSAVFSRGGERRKLT